VTDTDRGALFDAYVVRRLRDMNEPALAAAAPEIIAALSQAAAWLVSGRERLDAVASPLAGHVGNTTDAALRQVRQALLRLTTDEQTAQSSTRA
jgi:hypothetical protein